MKVILSRKGFDSKFGGQPSPILPDGTLLSLPIPGTEGETVKYTELYHEGKSLLDIILELRPGTKKIGYDTSVHLDPDIRKSVYKNRLKNWKPLFGQCDAAQGLLFNQSISENDLFLFFGTFRKTEYINGKLCYSKSSPDKHIIFGYFQIGKIYRYGEDLPEYTKFHPHASDYYRNKKSNCIYEAKDFLSFNKSLKGAGNFKFSESLMLTKQGDGMTKSKWELPGFFSNTKMTYHTENSYKGNYFQSRSLGQEFVIEPKDEVTNWAKTFFS